MKSAHGALPLALWLRYGETRWLMKANAAKLQLMVKKYGEENQALQLVSRKYRREMYQTRWRAASTLHATLARRRAAASLLRRATALQ